MDSSNSFNKRSLSPPNEKINNVDEERKRNRIDIHVKKIESEDRDSQINRIDVINERDYEDKDRRGIGNSDKVRERDRMGEKIKDIDKVREKEKVRYSINDRERERGKDREREIEKDRERERGKDRDRKDREKEKDRDNVRGHEREKGRGSDNEKKDRGVDGEKDREKDREKLIEIDKEKVKETAMEIVGEIVRVKSRENDKDRRTDKNKDRGMDRQTISEKDSKERGKDKDRHTDREKDRDRQTISEKDSKERGKDKDRHTDREKDRDRQTISEKDSKERGKDKDRHTDREKDRDRQTISEKDSKERGKDKDRHTDRDKQTISEKDRVKDNDKQKDRKKIEDTAIEIEKRNDKVDEKEKDEERERGKDREKERDQVEESAIHNDIVTDNRKEREKEKKKDNEKHRGKEKEKKEKDRSRDHGRSRERSRERRADRDRERDRERERERDDRERERQRDRERRDRDRDREERRAQRREAEKKKDQEDEESGQKTVTLASIIAANPGISVIEAVQRLQAANLNLSMGGGSSMGGGGGMMMMPTTIMSSGMPPNASLTGVIGVGGAATKFARELYVGNLPPGVTVPQLTEFLNAAMKQLGLGTGQGSVVSAWVSGDGHYAFVEFRTIEECNASLTYLNGLQIGVHQLRVGRPKSFGGSPVVPPALMGIGSMPNLLSTTPMGAGGGPLGMSALQLGALQGMGTGMLGFGATGGANSSTVNAGMSSMLAMSMAMSMSGGSSQSVTDSNVLMLTNLPLIIEGEQVKELLSPFGQIKAFNLIKDPSGLSRGSAVFEYTDPSTAEIALKGLEGLQLGEMRLSIQRVPAQMAALLLQPSTSTSTITNDTAVAAALHTITSISTEKSVVSKVGSVSDSTDDALANSPPSCVVRLGNMITLADLQDDDLFEELQEDVADECNTHGTVRAVHIPRPLVGATEEENLSRGVGYVFVQFTAIEGATKARAAIAGRSFNGKAVTASYYPEELFPPKGGSSKLTVEDSLD